MGGDGRMYVQGASGTENFITSNVLFLLLIKIRWSKYDKILVIVNLNGYVGGVIFLVHLYFLKN